MPIIVDKEKICQSIILAFQECTKETPLTKVTMRQVAQKAGMSHANILHYFGSRQELLLSYISYVSQQYVSFYRNWLSNIESNFHPYEKREYIVRLVKDVIKFDSTEHIRVFIQIYSLAQYDNALKHIVEQSYHDWRNAIHNILLELYGKDLWPTADALMVIIEGLLVYSLNDTLSDDQINGLLSALTGL